MTDRQLKRHGSQNCRLCLTRGDFILRLGQPQKAIVMFGIEWLKDGSVVDREASVLKTEGEVVENAYARAPEVAARLIGHEPDGFRLRMRLATT